MENNKQNDRHAFDNMDKKSLNFLLKIKIACPCNSTLLQSGYLSFHFI